MKTVNRMKLLAQINDSRISLAVPLVLRELVAEASKEENMNESQWVKMALIEKLERDSEVE